MTHTPRFYVNALNYFSTPRNLTESCKSYSASQFECTPAGNNGAISAAYLGKPDKTTTTVCAIQLPAGQPHFGKHPHPPSL